MGNTEAHEEFEDEEGLEDGTMHEVQLIATGFLSIAGVTAYHTSVVVDKREYLFDSLGIMIAPPMWSHIAGSSRGQPPTEESLKQTEVLYYGSSEMSGVAMAKTLRPHFMKDTYDILYKNCNHFTDCALYVLLTTRLPGKYSRGERLLTATDPVSTGIMNRAFKSFMEKKTGFPCETNIYETNPLAEGFSVQDVIAAVDEGPETDDEGELTLAGANLDGGFTQTHPSRQGSAMSSRTPCKHGLFTTTLEKSVSEKWGLNLDCGFQTRIQVVSLFDGAVSRHNALQPEWKIDVGDWIEKVNFEDRSAAAMANIIKTHNKMQVSIRKSWYNADVAPSSQTTVTSARPQTLVRFVTGPGAQTPAHPVPNGSLHSTVTASSLQAPAHAVHAVPSGSLQIHRSLGISIQAQSPSRPAMPSKVLSLASSSNA